MRSILLEFWKPADVPNNTRWTGSIRIDINRCGMRLLKEEEILVASGDSSEKILATLPELTGHVLQGIEISPGVGDVCFAFDGHLKLLCFPTLSDGLNCWLISTEE